MFQIKVYLLELNLYKVNSLSLKKNLKGFLENLDQSKIDFVKKCFWVINSSKNPYNSFKELLFKSNFSLLYLPKKNFDKQAPERLFITN